MERDDFTCQNEFVGFDGCLNRGPFSAYKRQYRLHKQRQTVIIPHQKSFPLVFNVLAAVPPCSHQTLQGSLIKNSFSLKLSRKLCPNSSSSSVNGTNHVFACTANPDFNYLLNENQYLLVYFYDSISNFQCAVR